MKIIILGPAFPLRGGIADFNEALTANLLQEGIETSIFSFYFQYPSFLFPGSSQKIEGKKPEHFHIHPTVSSINPFSWFNTAGKITNEKPDLVIIRYWLPFMAPALGTIAKRLRKNKIKVIAITDNIIPHEKRPGDKLLTGYFIRNCDAFITMSKAVYDQLGEFIKTDHKLFLPHPVYNIFGDKISKTEARKNIGLNQNDRIILFFGFIRTYKGLHLLLDAMCDQRIRERNIKLLVAGEFYEDKNPYLEKIRENKISKSIILHSGFIDKNKVKDYFCAADLVVQPYLDATQSGITQIAYFFGRPMLVTNVGGLAEIVADKRVGYVTEKKSSAIADAICDYYDNNREEMFSQNVNIDKEKFTWKNFINGILNLHDKISRN